MTWGIKKSVRRIKTFVKYGKIETRSACLILICIYYIPWSAKFSQRFTCPTLFSHNPKDLKEYDVTFLLGVECNNIWSSVPLELRSEGIGNLENSNLCVAYIV